MSELVTLSKTSPEFESYLLGTFSQQKRALPIQTLNVNSAAETVTFRILETQRIAKPSALAVVVQAAKLRNLIFVLFPLLLILTKNIVDAAVMDPAILLLTVVGAVLSFLAASLRNDYTDHMKGLDRILDTSGSRVIQKGWITAEQVKSLSLVFLILAVLCAGPLVFVYPSLSLVFLLALTVGLWAQFNKAGSFKYRIGGELALFLLLGPLLTVGLQMAFTGQFDTESLWLGVVWGWAVLFVVHLRNFFNILPSAQAGFSNTVNWLGFDKARRCLALWWGALVVANLIYHLRFSTVEVGAAESAILALGALPFIYRLKKISSPVGSQLRETYRSGHYLFLLAVSLWVIECLWLLLS